MGKNDHRVESGEMQDQVKDHIDRALLCGHFPDLNTVLSLYGGEAGVVHEVKGYPVVDSEVNEKTGNVYAFPDRKS